MLKREWFCLCACRQAEAATDEVYAQVSLVPDSEVLLSSHYFFFKCHFYFKCSAVVFFFFLSHSEFVPGSTLSNFFST